MKLSRTKSKHISNLNLSHNPNIMWAPLSNSSRQSISKPPPYTDMPALKGFNQHSWTTNSLLPESSYLDHNQSCIWNIDTLSPPCQTSKTLILLHWDLPLRFHSEISTFSLSDLYISTLRPQNPDIQDFQDSTRSGTFTFPPAIYMLN